MLGESKPKGPKRELRMAGSLNVLERRVLSGTSSGGSNDGFIGIGQWFRVKD
jgi:hypothetical protein